MIGSEKDIVRKDSNTEKTTINIFGCCVSRDLFPDNQELYSIQQYVAISSPMSIYLPSPSYEITEDMLEDFLTVKGDNFRRRCTILDHNNQCFEYISKQISDYIIVDIADSRLSIAQFDGEHYVSCAIFMSRYREKFESIFGKLNVHAFDYWSKDQWAECINWFCNELLKRYGRKNIILNEVYCVDEYLTKSNSIHSFSEKRVKLNHKINAHLKYVYDLCKEKLNGCHIIRMPEYVFADSSHKLGLLPLHYNQLYYEYAFNALRAITDGDSKSEEKTLNDLYEKYSELFKSKYYEVQYKKYESENKKMLSYISCFMNIIDDYSNVLSKIDSFLNDNNIRSVAFYGDFKITEVLMILLRKKSVSFDYIIGWWNNHPDIPLISPDSDSFPETDAIFVCNVQNIDSGIKKLQNKTSIPVISVYDLLPE